MLLAGIMVTSTQHNITTTINTTLQTTIKQLSSHKYIHSLTMHAHIQTSMLTVKVQRRQLGQTLQCRYQCFHTLHTDVVGWYHGDINTKQRHNNHQHHTTNNHKTTTITHIHTLTHNPCTHSNINTHPKGSASSTGTNSSVPVPALSHPHHRSCCLVSW